MILWSIKQACATSVLKSTGPQKKGLTSLRMLKPYGYLMDPVAPSKAKHATHAPVPRVTLVYILTPFSF